LEIQQLQKTSACGVTVMQILSTNHGLGTHGKNVA